jgi:hypothetical protein
MAPGGDWVFARITRLAQAGLDALLPAVLDRAFRGEF